VTAATVIMAALRSWCGHSIFSYWRQLPEASNWIH